MCDGEWHQFELQSGNKRKFSILNASEAVRSLAEREPELIRS